MAGLRVAVTLSDPSIVDADSPSSRPTCPGSVSPDHQKRPSDGPGRILVVDDSLVAVEMMTGLLETEGHEVVTADSAAAALEQAIAQAVDVMVCDLHMPDMDGFGVVTRLQALQADTPVIYASADNSLESVLRAMQLHVFGYVLKRGDSIRLLPSMVNKALAHVRALRRNRELAIELRRANEWLEQRVDQRTAELQSAVRRLEEGERELRRTLGLLEESREHALLNERLAALGILAAGVAHDVNNPAAYVMSNLRSARDYLQEMKQIWGIPAAPATPACSIPPVSSDGTIGTEMMAAFLWARTDQMLAESLDGMQRVLTTVADVTEFSRPETAAPEFVDLNEVVMAAAKIMRNQVRHRARLEVELADDAHTNATRGRLVQVLVNLLANAAQSITEGNAEGNRIRVSTLASSTDVFLQVADTGCGIPPDLLDRVRDPFFTTKPPSQGTGLGLTLCTRIVDELKGRLDISSEVGVGTCVTITLRRSLAAPLQKPAPAEGTRTPVLDGLSILLIDDEEALLRALRRELRARNQVTLARGGAEAIAALERDANFDFVVCDLMMPDVDGPMVFSAIQSRWPDLARRVAFVTGGAFTARSRHFLSSVEVPVLTKPVTIEQLARVFEQIAGAVLARDCVHVQQSGAPTCETPHALERQPR